MEYITAEQFLKQPEKVQKAFIDWWKPEYFDIVSFQDDTSVENAITGFGHNESTELIYCSDDNMGEKEDLIPCLTEGQLRHFIKDKLNNCTIEIKTDCYGYIFDLGNKYIFESEKSNLLQAYWEVACKIAKEDDSNVADTV